MTAQRTASMTPAGTGTTVTTRRGLARRAWHRIGDVIGEMNHATRRLTELNGRPAGNGA